MFKTILLPLDLGDEAEAKHLFGAASSLAKTMDARLHVLTVVPAFSMPMVASFFPEDFEKTAIAHSHDELEKFVAAHDAAGQVDSKIIGHGSVYKEVVRVAHETQCDVIVLGPGSKDTGDFLLGHNAARVMRHASCSVVLLRG